MLDGYSSAAVTTFSPSFHGKPSATRPIPCVVLLTKAISSTWAPISPAASALVFSIFDSQRGQLTTPFASCSSIQARIARPERAGRGETAAWSK